MIRRALVRRIIFSIVAGLMSGITVLSPLVKASPDMSINSSNEDPTVIWNTFFPGGTVGLINGMRSIDIKTDNSGNVFLTGVSEINWGSPIREYEGNQEAFVVRLDSDGNLVWSTFLGGNSDDFGFGIALDESGNVFVTGMSRGTWGSPIREYTENYGGGFNSFVAKLDNNGNLIWNTFFASPDGYGDCRGIDIDTDGNGNVFVTGSSATDWGTPIQTVDGYFNGYSNVFVAKLDNSGNLIWNTFLGGTGVDNGEGIVVDNSGNIYIVGRSRASWGSPILPFISDYNHFISKLDNNGNFIWNTFLGGGFLEGLPGITSDIDGNVYITGSADTSWGSPIVAFTPGMDTFVNKVDSNGNLIWNTFIGEPIGNSITVTSSGNLYVVGETEGIFSRLDTYVSKLDNNGYLLGNALLGGGGDDLAFGIDSYGGGTICVCGQSSYSTWGFPLNPFTGSVDYFVVKLDDGGGINPLPIITSLVPNSGNQGQTLPGVLINGTNLTDATAITFSGTGVTASSLSMNAAGTQISANISVDGSAEVGARDVVVTTTMGTSTSLAGGFTINSSSLTITPDLLHLNKGEVRVIHGLVTDSTGAPMSNIQIGINDPIKSSSQYVYSNDQGQFSYMVTANKVGSFSLAFYTPNNITKTCIVNIGVNPIYSIFSNLKIRNTGINPIQVTISNGDTQGIINVGVGQIQPLISFDSLDYSSFSTGSELCAPLPIGGGICISNDGTISVSGGEGLQFGGYATKNGNLGICGGVGGSLPYVVGASGFFCIGSDGMSIQGSAGPSIAHGTFSIKVKSLNVDNVIPYIQFVAHSPVSLLVTDPNGGKIGFDSNTGIVDQIPWGTYSGPSSEPQIISIPQLVPGEYEVHITGTDNGAYGLSYKVTSGDEVLFDQEFSGSITESDNLESKLTASQDNNRSYSITATNPAIPVTDNWSEYSAPTTVLDVDVIDMAVASNGTTGYAATTNNMIYKTLDGGITWIPTAFAGGTVKKLAVASDVADGSLVTVATANAAYISTDGGESFTTVSTGTTLNQIRSIAISPQVNASRSVAIAADSSVWLCTSNTTFGSSAGWTDIMASGNIAIGPALAVKFSPNYIIDRNLVVVTSDGTYSRLNQYNTVVQMWNADYPPYEMPNLGFILNTGSTDTAADIALAPSYMAFDKSQRLAYVALNNGGLYRNNTQLSSIPLYSVAINSSGDKLIAGPVTGNVIYSFNSPATASASDISTSWKNPGCAIDGNVSVEFFGTNAGAATMGTESAFALSADVNNFNDVAFIDTNANLVDFAVNTDGSKLYAVTYNPISGLSSLWSRRTVWERIYKANGSGYIIRPALDNFDSIFFVQTGTENIWFSNNAGQTVLIPRVAYDPVADFATESAAVLYSITTTGEVQKSTDGGYFWNPSGTVSVGAGGSMTLLSSGKLLIAGTVGVSYTTDGGTTWVSPVLTLNNARKAVATTLASGDTITAITDTGIYSYTIGTDTAFTNVITTDGIPNGITIDNGITYVMTTLMTYCLPTSGAWNRIDSVGYVGLESGPTGKLYSMNIGTFPNRIDIYSATSQVAGLLRVQTDPPVSTRIYIDGVPRDDWALNWVKMDQGDYMFSFSDVYNYNVPSSVTVNYYPGTTGNVQSLSTPIHITDGVVTEVIAHFVQLGNLRVETSPAMPATIYCNGQPMDDWAFWTNILPGDYTVSFESIDGFITPQTQVVHVDAGATTHVTGTYTAGTNTVTPAAHGLLRVQTDPAVPTTILLNGIQRDDWGLNWVKMTPGDYMLSFSDVYYRDVPGTVTVNYYPGTTGNVQSLSTPIHITDGVVTEVIVNFVQLGNLRVETSPAVPATIYCNGHPIDDWAFWSNIEAGSYEISFQPMDGYLTPPPLTVTVNPGVGTHVIGDYSTGQTTVVP